MPAYETPQAPEKTRVGLVNRSASVQSVINITYPVKLPVGSDDAIKVRVMNQILGGGFSGKLNMNLREDKGYTYGSRSSLSSDELVSRFNASADVRNEVTDSAIVQMIYEIEQMRSGEISEEELELAKNSISGSFSRSLEQPQTVANFALNIAIYDLPEDYYNTYLQKVQAVTIDDVKATAMKYLKPESTYINVVGKASEVADKLKAFGELTYYDTYGNEVDPSLAKLPAGLTAEKVIADYKNAIGGDNILEKFNNVVLELEAETFGQKLPMTYIMTKNLESKMSILYNGQLAMEVIATKENASTKQMGRSVPMQEEQKEELTFANGIFTEFSFSEFGVETKLIGIEEVNGSDAYVIEVSLPKGSKYMLFFDVETGLKVRHSKILKTPNGTINSIIDYQDYKEVEGLQVFHTLIQQTGPQKMSASVKEIKINQDLPEGLFKVE